MSGKGGAGCSSFRREKFVPFGGPDGGDGGRGGHVTIKADKRLNTLLDQRYQQQYKAKNGQPGMGQKRFGRDGTDMVVEVPVGTIVRNLETQEILVDLDTDGQIYQAATGGKGGLGNVHFTSSVRQAPTYAQPGLPGQEM